MKHFFFYTIVFFISMSYHASAMELVDQFIQSLFTAEAEAFPTPLLQAAQDGDEEKIAQLLMEGTSLMAKGKDGMTVFHKVVCNVAYNEEKNDNVLKALIIYPRSGTINTVTQLLDIKEGKVLERLVHWHISGLVRVLAVEDSNAKRAVEYADRLWEEILWSREKIVENFCEEIKEGYKEILDEKVTQELYE